MSAQPTYTPSPDSVAGRVLAYLRKQRTGARVETAVLAHELRVPPSSMSGCMTMAVNAGLVHKLPVDGGRKIVWVLGPRPALEPVPEVLRADAEAAPAPTPEPQPEPEPEPESNADEESVRQLEELITPEADEHVAEAEPAQEEEAQACFALFDDGRLYIERGDETFTLQAGETDRLLRYLGRLTADEAQAPTPTPTQIVVNHDLLGNAEVLKAALAALNNAHCGSIARNQFVYALSSIAQGQTS